MAKSASYNICDHDKSTRDETSYSLRYSAFSDCFSECCGFLWQGGSHCFSLRKLWTTIIEFKNSSFAENTYFAIDDTFHCVGIEQFFAKSYLYPRFLCKVETNITFRLKLTLPVNNKSQIFRQVLLFIQVKSKSDREVVCFFMNTIYDRSQPTLFMKKKNWKTNVKINK